MENKDTIVLYTYKYIWKEKNTDNGSLCVKFITGTLQEHETFSNALRENENIESAMCEYVSEINLAFFGFTTEIKKPIKEDEKNDEKI